MDVNLPDGTTVRNVPDGTSRADLVQKLRANGRDVPAEWLAAPKASAKSAPAPDKAGGILDAAKDSVGDVYNVARGAVMGPLSDVAGLASIPLHAAGAISTPPIDVKRNVQEAGAYTPTTPFGTAAAAYNPFALIGKGVEKVAGAAERGVGGKDPGPLRAAAGYAARGAVEQAPNLLGAKIGEGASARTAAKQGELDVARGTNSRLDALRDDAQRSGILTPPEGKSWFSGLPGVGKIDKWVSAANQPEFNRLMREQFKLPDGTALSPEVLDNVRAEAGKKYDEIIKSGYGDEITERPPPKEVTSAILDERGKPITRSVEQPETTRIQGLPATPEFKSSMQQSLATTEEKLKADPETFRSLRSSARLLRHYAKQNEFEPQVAMEAIKQLRHDASAEFKSDDPGKLASAFTRREIANQLENVFESNLEAKGDTKLLQDFRQARKTIAQSYDVEKALDPAGNVDARKLAAIGQRRPLSENLKLVSDYARVFPKGAQKVGEIPRLSFFDLIVAGGALASGHPGLALGEVGTRVGLPFAAQRGMFQSHTPPYSAGRPLSGMVPPLSLLATGQENQIPPPPM